MAVKDVISLARQAAETGFRKLVITGGEPLMHPQREALLDALARLRQSLKPMKITLRTNLAYHFTWEGAKELLAAVDEIVVSVDGGQENHEAQRGVGTYQKTVDNLRMLASQMAEWRDQIMIAAALTEDQMACPDGEAVRALGEELGMRTRLKPILPLGRGMGLDLKLSFYSSLDEDIDRLAYGSRPASTCGLGMNLFIGTDGQCYPCYTLMASQHNLGNALLDGLNNVLARNDAYRAVTVDSNRKCRICALRYLCGGFCRAWGDSADPDASLEDCTVLYQRATGMLRTALGVLEIKMADWEDAGLPV